MKKKILKLLFVLFVILFFCVGLVPSVNLFLRGIITYEEYKLLIYFIVFISFELIFYLKTYERLEVSFGLMKSSVSFKRLRKEKKFNFDETGYYRDIPFNGDLFKFFWIAYQYDIVDNRTILLNALLLKWCEEGRISFVSNGKYEIINTDMDFDDGNEAEIYYLLVNSQKNRFVKLSMFNSKAIFNKIDDVLLVETSLMRNENKIIIRGNKEFIEKSVNDDARIVYEFKNFLLNFSNMNEKNLNEVKLWKEYLVYAELLGISKEVRKEFYNLGINYVFKEVTFKKINIGLIFIIRILLFISYMFYGVLFLLFTFIIWNIYIKLTWS